MVRVGASVPNDAIRLRPTATESAVPEAPQTRNEANEPFVRR